MVSNPPPPPIFFSVQHDKLFGATVVTPRTKLKRDKTHSTSKGWEKEQKKQSKARDRRFNKQLAKERQ